MFRMHERMDHDENYRLDTLESKYGKMNPENHPTFIKEMKRLEKIWKRDKDLFQLELDKI